MQHQHHSDKPNHAERTAHFSHLKDKEKDKFSNPFSLVSAALDEKLAEQEIIHQSFLEKKKLAEEYFQQLLRLKAEFENYRKRSEQDKEKQFHRGKLVILMELIGFVDLFTHALSFPAETVTVDNMRQGIDLLRRELEAFINRQGVKAMQTVGKKFDPIFHEAIMQEDITEGEEDIIVEELQRGYLINDIVIRPARVKVTKCKHAKPVSCEDNVSDVQEKQEPKE